jgi:alkanesulfonate monooxygenase SsuD/methylene tetrahydromethanopterin reductase-like flavin-dependent oxidoreductase (luciferase family)
MELGLYTFADVGPEIDPARRLHDLLEDQQAGDEYFPTYAAMMNRIGRERGWSPMGRGQFEMGRSPRGALLVGSPEEVVEKILFEHELFGHSRFMAQISVGTLPHEKVMRAIELYGTEVAPAVRKEIEGRSASGEGPAAIR